MTITLELSGLSVYSVDEYSFWDDRFGLQEGLGMAQGGGMLLEFRCIKYSFQFVQVHRFILWVELGMAGGSGCIKLKGLV